jgi:hypothetical protein
MPMKIEQSITIDQLTAAVRYLGWQIGTADDVLSQIVLSHQFPPIPPRCFDWLMYFRGQEEGLQGWGKTLEEAIANLFTEIEEAAA